MVFNKSIDGGSKRKALELINNQSCMESNLDDGKIFTLRHR